MNINLSSGKIVSVTAEPGNKPANWYPSGDNYKVTVKVDGKRATFDFWDSYHNTVNGIEVDLRGALSCFAGDALNGNQFDVDEIASEFGYTKPSDAIRVWKGLQKAQKQAKRLGLTDDELSELAEY